MSNNISKVNPDNNINVNDTSYSMMKLLKKVCTIQQPGSLTNTYFLTLIMLKDIKYINF